MSSESDLIGTMARIRAFELRLLELFAEGALSGTTHTCVGQEACAAALYAHLNPDIDVVFTNHRGHGHYLAYGGDMYGLMAEIMGRQGGVCGGRGGSQHLCHERFFSNGVQGGGLPIAAGYAYELTRTGREGIVVVHIGDGTLGQGVLYETLNMVALLSLPLLIVLEHNGFAQSTDTSMTTAGDVVSRFEAFGLMVDRTAESDPVALSAHLAGIVHQVRHGTPCVQIMDTFRLMPHSKGDEHRPPELLEQAWQEDWLEQRRTCDSVTQQIVSNAEEEVKSICTAVAAAPLQKVTSWDAFAHPPAPLFEDSRDLAYTGADTGERRRINELLGLAVYQAMQEDPRVILVGEDLLDPYGGAFKVSRGLSTAFPDQVFSTPISEAAIVGLGNGIAIAGGRPIVEIMFADFVMLAMDQLVNQASKMYYMYGEQVRVPLTIRLVSGGYRGYGPTHSQSTEGFLCGVPGLKVIALSRRHSPEALLCSAIMKDDNPVIFVENKMLYTLYPHTTPPTGFIARIVPAWDDHHYPELAYTTATETDAIADVTVVTYGGLTDIVEATMLEMILEEELDFDYIILSQLSPLHAEGVIDSANRTRRLLVLEEGPSALGIGAAVLAAVGEATTGVAMRRVGAKAVPIPSARHQEAETLPSRETVMDAIASLL